LWRGWHLFGLSGESKGSEQMSFEHIQKLPNVDELKKEVPISEELQKVKANRDQEIKEIFLRKSKKFLLIIGPCSADNEDAVCEYVSRLSKLQDQVKDQLLTSFTLSG